MATQNLFSKFLVWLLQTSLFASFCALALCQATLCLFTESIAAIPYALYGMVAGGTLISYNAHYLVNHFLTYKKLRLLIKQLPWQLVCTLFGFLLVALSTPYLSIFVIAIAVLGGILGMAYTMPILPFANRVSLRDFGILKVVTLTSVWVVATTVLPSVYLGIVGNKMWILCGLRFLLIFPLCIAFNVRDINVDKASQILTIAVRKGSRFSLNIAYSSLTLFAVLSTIFYFHYWGIGSLLLAPMASSTLATLAIILAHKRPTFYTHLLLIDGIMLLDGLLTILLL